MVGTFACPFDHDVRSPVHLGPIAAKVTDPGRIFGRAKWRVIAALAVKTIFTRPAGQDVRIARADERVVAITPETHLCPVRAEERIIGFIKA
jgi:hypothetical protein